MNHLDQLIAQERTIKTQVNYVGMFKRDPKVMKYILDARGQHAAAVEARDRVSSDMEKIRYLAHTGRDLRFRGCRDLLNLVQEFDLSSGAILHFLDGERWLENLQNHQFHPVRVHDWREVLVNRMLEELREFFQGVFGLAANLNRVHQQGNWLVKDISEKNPRPLMESMASHGNEPVVKEQAHKVLTNLDE
jgi:hypothetical protein